MYNSKLLQVSLTFVYLSKLTVSYLRFILSRGFDHFRKVPRVRYEHHVALGHYEYVSSGQRYNHVLHLRRGQKNWHLSYYLRPANPPLF